jgi:hypothetical protein
MIRNNSISKRKGMTSSTAMVCFMDTLWNIGCSVMAGSIPAFK